MTFPGTRPARRVHVPPPPSGQLPDPGGQDSVQRAHRRQQQVADLYTRWRGSFPDGIDPDELKNLAGQFAYTDAALQLPGVLDAVKRDADAATQKASDLIKGTRVGEDVASQIQAQRYWARAQRTLDAQRDGAKTVAAARDLINSADDLQVPVLSEELGSYLASRSLPVDWLAGALADKIPGLADATSDAILKSRQHAVISANHSKIQKAMESDTSVPPLIDPSDMTSAPYLGGLGA